MKKYYHFNISIAILFSIVMLFSCQNDTKKKSKKGRITQKVPMGEAQNFQLIYTDSTKVRAILNSQKNQDFSNQKFPYTEFPNGLTITFFNDDDQQSTLKAQYGIYYLRTQMVLLKDSVELLTHEGKTLQTDLLYWNEKENWVFTDRPFTFTDTIQKSVTKGIGMDFDRNFKTLKAHKVTGLIPLQE